MPNREPQQRPDGSWTLNHNELGWNIRQKLEDLIGRSLPVLFKSLASRFWIEVSEAEKFFSDHVSIIFQRYDSEESGSVAFCQVHMDRDIARVTINTGDNNVANWSVDEVAGMLAHELEHFFQDTLLYERDEERHENEDKYPWIDRDHEQSAIIAEIRMAKERGESREDFISKYDGCDDFDQRKEVIKYLWDLEDDCGTSKRSW